MPQSCNGGSRNGVSEQKTVYPSMAARSVGWVTWSSLRFSSSSWRMQNAPQLLQNPRRFPNHTRHPDSRHLCVSQLVVGERAVAWEIGHRDGATYRSFLAAFDPALAELGTGVALQLEVIGWCAQEGLRTYDLLPPHTDFKARWASDTATVLTAVVPLRRRAAMLVPLLRDGRAGLKRLVARLPDSVQTTAWRLARARQRLG